MICRYGLFPFLLSMGLSGSSFADATFTPAENVYAVPDCKYLAQDEELDIDENVLNERIGAIFHVAMEASGFQPLMDGDQRYRAADCGLIIILDTFPKYQGFGTKYQIAVGKGAFLRFYDDPEFEIPYVLSAG